MKRKGEGGGRDRKRARLDSRKIKVQHNDPALKDGRLDVPTFLKTREFEIKQLQQTMEKSKKAGTKRAFQKVPRELRRRTASHNVKRVPPRLRKRAIQELDEKSDKKLTKLGRGHERAKHLAIEKQRTKDKQQEVICDVTGVNERAEAPTGGRYKDRQKDKVWLPTHVWHKKRAHLETKWGLAIPTRPTAKSYRPTHRAATENGAVAWDASYFSTIVVLNQFQEALASVGAHDAHGARYKTGKRCWEGMMSVSGEPQGPGMVYWRANGELLLVRVHPAMFAKVFDTLASKAQVHDCRYAIGSIDITGPKSLFALRSVLKSVGGSAQWDKMASISNSKSIPKTALTLDVYDPRLFTPKGFRPKKQCEFVQPELHASDLFTPDGRQSSLTSQPTMKQLHERSTEPGKDIKPVESDPKIPVVLLKRDDESWNLLVPWHWVKHFWYQLLTIPDVRLGGLEQRHQLAYESGRLFFPHDYPLTPAGRIQHDDWIKRNKEKREARPVAKRPNYNYSFSWDELESDIRPAKVSLSKGNVTTGARIYIRDMAGKTLVGFITSASYNLALGKGYAIGWVVNRNYADYDLCLCNMESADTERPVLELRFI